MLSPNLKAAALLICVGGYWWMYIKTLWAANVCYPYTKLNCVAVGERFRFCHNATMWCRVHVSCMLCLYIIFPSLMLHANTIMPTIPHPQYAKEVGGLRPYPTMKGFGFQCSWPLHMCTKYFNHYRWDNVHKLECDLRGIIPLRAILTSRSHIQFVWDG